MLTQQLAYAVLAHRFLHCIIRYILTSRNMQRTTFNASSHPRNGTDMNSVCISPPAGAYTVFKVAFAHHLQHHAEL